MKRAIPMIAPALLAGALPAEAADYNAAVNANLTDYSNGFGSRRETTAESTTRFGATSFTIGLSQARRKYEDESYSAVRLAGSLYQNWTDRFYSRTYGSVSSGKPVFATRELGADLNFKLLPNTVATVGGKASRYHGRRDALAWSAGATHYFAGGFATYRFTGYDVEGRGKSHGHLATLRIKDGAGKGSTQLWLGAGNSLHEELLTTDRRGKFRSVALQRIQPVEGPVSLSVSLGRTWYDTPGGDYRGTRVAVGLMIDDRIFGGQSSRGRTPL